MTRSITVTTTTLTVLFFLLQTASLTYCRKETRDIQSEDNLNQIITTELYPVDENSLARLADNLGLVDDEGNIVTLTDEEGMKLEERITPLQLQIGLNTSTVSSNETRTAPFVKYLVYKSLHELIQALWQKDGGSAPENLCNATTCDQNSTEPYCKPSDGLCAECLSDQTCENPSFPFCQSNDCKQCISSSDCSGNRLKQLCGKQSQNCGECFQDSDCQGKVNKRCDLNTFTCVQCLEDTDCGELYPCTLQGGCPTQYCSATNTCSTCTIDEHCRFCPPTPVCGPISPANQTARRRRVGGSRSLAQLDEDTTIPTACLQCLQDSDCARFNGTRNFCDKSLCSQCRNDTTCPDASPFCVDGNCKKCPNGEDVCTLGKTCQSNKDCPDILVPFCGGTLNDSCVECTTNDHCSLPNPICSLNNTCAQCSQDGDCGPPNSYCVKGRCSECQTDEQCQSPLPRCSIDDATCVQCLSSEDCGSGFAGCDPISRTCVEV